MYPPGSPYFQGASTAPSPVAAMAGRVDNFDGGQAGNFQLFLPPHSRGRPTELATSESTGTNSSQYSIPSNNLAFENCKVLIFLTHLFGLFIQVKFWRQHPQPHPPSSLAGLTFRLTVHLFPLSNIVHYKHDMKRSIESIPTSWKNVSFWKLRTRCSSMYYKL